ncbi:MAG: metallophosphoesterase [Planctomycetes bacterium]|nr:metallophosphoesterase [Planctomycetota bacterium]
MKIHLLRRFARAAQSASLWLACCALASAQTVLVKPYLQPGDGAIRGKSDAKVLCWLTDQTPGDFSVEYGVTGAPPLRAKAERIALDFAKASDAKPVGDVKPSGLSEKSGSSVLEKEQHYFRYTAKLTDLPLDSEVRYQVRLGDGMVRESSFRTMASPEKPVRFALAGDLSTGKKPQRAIAHRISQEKPDFLVALGDIVYPSGRVSQYMAHYWSTYNDVDVPGPESGAPLMASVPFYPVLGNHDVAAKFPATPDALGVYYFFQPPKNGPGPGPWNTQLGSGRAALAAFRAATAESYPFIDAYSFDNGPVHVMVINSNQSSNVDQSGLKAWVERDLKASKANWKLACFHNPAFSSSHQHYTEQSVRLWQPVFEACGVDLVFTGHVHNYQRTVPLRFMPASPKRDKRGRSDGEFKLDKAFDGKVNTRPDGIIHVVAGGGGATLYGPGLEKTSQTLRKEHGDNYADYTAMMVVDRHSFVMLDAKPDGMRLRAIDASGKAFDDILITKPAN